MSIINKIKAFIKKISYKNQSVPDNKNSQDYKLGGTNNKIIIIEEDGTERELAEHETIDGLNIEMFGNNNKIIIKQPSIFKKSFFKIAEPCSNVEITIDKAASCMLYVTAWGASNQKFHFGKNTYMSEVGMVALCDEGAEVTIGENCLFAGNISLWGGDGHTVYDINTNEVLNLAKNKPIIIGNHCWIGAKSIFLKGAQIKENTIVAMGSIVTKTFDETNIILAGNPAKCVKRNVNWNRMMPWKYDAQNHK